MYYDYSRLLRDFGFQAKSIGKSYFGRDILAITFGKGGILFHGGIHAREHVTAELISFMAKYNGKRRLLANACFIPSVNPDGAELCIHGLSSVPPDYREKLQRINENETDFSLWKANGRGVDLNLNFDADWGKGKGNLTYPFRHGYIGRCPFSESESRTLAQEFDRNGYSLTFSFHAKGEELYFGYDGYDPDPVLTRKVSDALGYKARQTLGSAGGFKDWCVSKRNVSAYTVEFGDDKKDYKKLYEDLPDLFRRCVLLMETVAKYER